MDCNACQLEMNALLSDMPSKWRAQIVNVICDHLSGQLSCKDVTSCLSSEMGLLDPLCLVGTQIEWDNLSYLGKVQKMIDKICATFSLSTFQILDTSTIQLDGNGTVDSPLTATLIIDPDSTNILTTSGSGAFVSPHPIIVSNDCIIFNVTTDSGVITYTPTIDADCLTSLVTPPAFVIHAENGTHLVGTDTLRLGGVLLEDTGIAAVGHKFSVYQNQSFFNFVDNGHQFFAGRGTGDPLTETITLSYLDAGYYNAQSSLRTSYESGTNYYAGGWLNVDKSTAVLGTTYPTTNTNISAPALLPQTSSFFRAKNAATDVYANIISLASPTAVITSGNLVSGSKYQILTAGGNFTASGSVDNNIGTIFTAGVGVPVWGGASLELLGNITLSINQSIYKVDKSGHYVSNYSTAASPNDYGVTSIYSSGYSETQLFRQGLKASGSYIADNAVRMTAKDTAGYRSTSIGVGVPSAVSPSSVPAATQATSTTTWTSNDTGPIQGTMTTVSPNVQFLGVTGVNGGLTKIGVNTNSATAAVDINNSGVPGLRIRGSYTPSSSSDTGNQGDTAWDANYHYQCIATNTWRRIAWTTVSGVPTW